MSEANNDPLVTAREVILSRQRVEIEQIYKDQGFSQLFQRGLRLAGAITAILIVLTILVGQTSHPDSNHREYRWAIVGTISFLLIYIAVVGLFYYRLLLRRRARDLYRARQVVELQAEEQEIVEKSESAEMAFASLWAATQKRIDLYHEIATAQARKSFLTGQLASGAGFIVILVIAIFAARSHNTTGAIAAGVVGTAGAGLSGYISATFAKAQSDASAQLSAFFLQPVEFARALGAERLVSLVPESERGKIVERIVQSMTPLSENKPASGGD